MSTHPLRLAVVFAVVSLLVSAARQARAETIAAPIGGKVVSLGPDRVSCGALEGGWTVDADARSLHPPTREEAIGHRVDALVAKSAEECAAHAAHVTLVATGPLPSLDPGTSLLVDDARVEARGRRLKGARIGWRLGADRGEDVCVDPRAEGGVERCSWSVRVDGDDALPTLTLLPAGAPFDPDLALFDADGRRVPTDQLAVSPSRVVLGRLVAGDAHVDASAPTATLALAHPSRVAAVDCAPAICRLEGGALVVSGADAASDTLSIRFTLTGRTTLRRGDAQESNPVVRVGVLRCPLSIVSGAPLRDLDQQTVVVALEGRCAADVDALRFMSRGVTLPVVARAKRGPAALLALRVGRVSDGELVVSASRDEDGRGVVGVAHAPTTAAPIVHATLTRGDGGALDFLPTNVDATISAVAPASLGDRAIVPLAVEGAYDVRREAGAHRARGLVTAGGLVTIRFAVRLATLPAPLDVLDLAIVADASQRAVRESSTPIPLSTDGATRAPIAELLCDPGDGVVAPVALGVLTHVPVTSADSCRLVLHRERIDAADGTQRLSLDVDVLRVDGASRPEAHMTRTIAVRHGDAPTTVWLHGATARFDHYLVRLGHVGDASDETDASASNAQWSVVTGRAHARLYATSAIPTGLFRVSDAAHSGLLTLNLGVLARLTWLDALGREGILAAEGGVMMVGLANDTSSTGRSLTQLATVVGVGIGVPIANRALATEASINLHAWLEYEPSRALSSEPGSAIGFVFGPSLSIGNLGTDF